MKYYMIALKSRPMSKALDKEVFPRLSLSFYVPSLKSTIGKTFV